ncbi:pikachurin [Eurytemora carolleeae]|uniref:pikachurin n=1 Tax=Eurytemora carolleeae TaxID=1294199 RepID=UPI000C78819C|nr:pikachurin [Eurytemora carolleeae]|eukprot:XP_023334989.1 pikachurin-like [Eurytemora affinis]
MAECLAQRSIPPVNFGTCTQVESPGNLSREDTRGCPSGTWVGVSGCRPCLCSKYGSEGSVCDRLTGQCRCLPGYAGHTCQVCQGGSNELSCRESREAGQHRDGNLFQPNIEKGVALRGRGRSNRRGESEEGKAMMPFSHSVEMNDGYMSDRTRNAISVFGTLGNLCNRDSDCSARDSTCISSVCECKGGYVQESPYSCKIMYPGPCMYTPCEAGGTCEEHDGTFTCYCSSDRSGKYCEKAKQVQEAGFSGASYVTLRYLPSSVTSTTLDLEIKPYSPDGILLIARQNQNGKGDFFSIYLKKGHVEVKYDLGSGPVTLTSSTPVNLGAWNKLAVKRYRQDCMVALNGGEPVTSSARGRNKSLNLRSYAFIGGIPASNFSGIFGMVGTTENFQGCIREVGTRGRGISLVSDSEPLLLSSHNISECSELACSRFSCKHGGTCSLRSSKPRCSCPQGFRGRRCNKRKKEKRGHKKRKYFSKVQIPFLKNKKEYKRYKYTIN